MVEHAEQPRVGVRQGRLLGPELEVIHGRGPVCTAYEVEPLLDGLLEDELRLVALSLRLEEGVEVEAVVLAAECHLANLVGHLVGEHDHARERLVWVRDAGVLARPRLLGLLLVGVRPVEDLLLDELARVECPEGRAGEEEVVACHDRQVALVHLVSRVHVAYAGVDVLLRVPLVLVLLLEERLGVLVPSAEVVLVEDDEVPVLLADPLVLRLDAPRPVSAEEVLEGAEADDWAGLVGRLVLLGDVRPARLLWPADELPSLEVDVRGEVLLPRRLHRRLEGQHQNTSEPHVLGELVGGEGLPEAHLGVPQELWRSCAALALDGAEVLLGLLHRRRLLRPHPEVARAPLDVRRSVAHGDVRGFHVVDGAAEPLRLLAVTVLQAVEAVCLEVRVNVMVHERGAISAHRRLDEHDLIGLLAGLERRVVLVHAFVDSSRGIADLK